MKQIISLKVPAEPKAESVSHGNWNADLEPGSTIEVTDERFASFLVSEYDLKEVDRRDATPKEEAAAEETPEPATEPADDETLLAYPEDFPGGEALASARVPYSTAKSLTAEQLAGYPGIGKATAKRIVKYFAAGGN